MNKAINCLWATLTAFAVSAMLAGLFVSCSNDDPVSPTPDPGNGETQFVYHEVWQYGNEWGDTVTVYLNTIDSTYQCSVQHSADNMRLLFHDGECGSLKIGLFPYYDYDRETGELYMVGDRYALSFVGRSFCDMFWVKMYDGNAIELRETGLVDYIVHINEYLFNKIQ